MGNAPGGGNQFGPPKGGDDEKKPKKKKFELGRRVVSERGEEERSGLVKLREDATSDQKDAD